MAKRDITPGEGLGCGPCISEEAFPIECNGEACIEIYSCLGARKQQDSKISGTRFTKTAGR